MSDHNDDLGQLTGPGVQVRQRIKITQNAKGGYQKEISIEVQGQLWAIHHIAGNTRLQADGTQFDLEEVNTALFRRAAADADQAIARMVAADREVVAA